MDLLNLPKIWRTTYQGLKNLIKPLSLTGLFVSAVVLAAITPVGASGIVDQSSTSANNNIATSLALPVPSGTSQGDVLIASLDVEGAPSITIPNGWSLIRSDTDPNAVHLLQADYVHVAAASEPASYTWTFSAADGASGGIIDYTGVDNSNPIDSTSGVTTAVNANPIIAPSVTASTANDMLVGIFGNGVNRTQTAPAGMTQRYTNSTTASGQKTTIYAFDQSLSASGATGTRSSAPNGSSVGIGQLIALKPAAANNNPPIVDSVVINQTAPMTNDTLTTSVSGHDPDGNTISYQYQWLLNGTAIPGATGSTLDLSQPGNGNKGDVISVTVTAFDGQLYSQPLTSAPVSIVNSPPSGTVSLDNPTPDLNANITATAVSSDPDDDQILNKFVWSVNGQTLFELDTSGNQSSMSLQAYSSELRYGDVITVSLTPTDGYNNGPTVSASATVTPPPPPDNPPVVDSVTINQAAPAAGSTLTSSVVGHDPDGDAITFSFQWADNGVNIQGATTGALNLNSAVEHKGDAITLTATAFDGQLYSQPLTSASVTIVDSAPVINSLNLAPAQPYTTSTLSATVSASDIDNDPISYTYAWSDNGNLVQTDNTASATDSINLSSFAQAGDVISVQVTPNDGTLNGASASGSVTVQQASSFGQITEYPIPGSQTPANITHGPDGNIWFTEESGANIVQINVSNGNTTPFAAPQPAAAEGTITTGPDGKLWFTVGNGKIGNLDPNSGVLKLFSLSSTKANPTGITVGPDGNLWFCEFETDKIGRITTSGAITEFKVPTASSEPHGMTLGPDGNLWFTEYNGNKIGRITTSGAITEFSIPTASSGASTIVAGSDGNLWFSEQLANKIGRITPAGTITEFPTPTTGSMPVGIVAAPDGNLWFTEKNANKIARITTTGVFTEYSLPTANSGPDKITVGSDGNLWFTEHTAGRIARFALH